ncbi:MAG TPA: shikimate dehydrogenase, partial [Elusimicrobia bacterium]|nr:shikimate dehydrogenase [Elusimicrobiota bacterium]
RNFDFLLEKMRITGIFGYPIKHSLSPVMHNAAFEILGLDFIYLPFEVKPADLEIAVKAIKVLGFKGVNVTVPHKEKVVKYLDKLDSSAKEVGAVNTISNENGKLIGYNTDGIGFLKSLAGKINLKNKNVLLLGCGGAGKG